MRKIIAALCAAFMLAAAAPAAAVQAAPKPIKVVVDATELQFDTPPFIEGGRTLVPLRTLAEALGFQVGYDPATERITLTRGEKQIELWVGFAKAYVDGKATPIEVAPKIAGGRTMVPVRFVAEQLGALVTWDPAAQLIYVRRGEGVARDLFERAQALEAANPFADRRVQGTVTTSLSIGGLFAGGNLDVDMPLTVDLHTYGGEMLLTTELVQPGGTGTIAMRSQQALRNGKLYSDANGTGDWILAGNASPEQVILASAGAGVLQAMQVPAAMMEAATYTLRGSEVIDGVTTQRVEVRLSGIKVSVLLQQMLAQLTGAADLGTDLRFGVERYVITQWIDPVTFRTHRVGIELGLSVATEGQSEMKVKVLLHGDLDYRHVSEPIQFPYMLGISNP